jgi:gluconate 5-dehydrogenase
MGHLDDLFGLSGQTALVTGASSGLGVEAAEALAKAGAAVGLVARRRERLEQVARTIEGLGAKACVSPADLRVTEEIEAAVDSVERELGPIDVLVNSAGVAPLSRALKHGRDKWDAALDINLTAPFITSQIVARRMIERGRGGRIIMMGSAVGGGGNPVHLAVGYSATKGALHNLTRHLAVEWAQHDIRVNAIAPSYFPTEMTIDPRIGDVDPDQRARMQQFTPLGRLGRRGELETAVLFLAAPASSYVTGAIIAVDGGWTAW